MKIKEVVKLWAADKIQYIKQSSFSTYMLIANKHILPKFGECENITEQNAQSFIFEKIDLGLSSKSVKDIIIVIKMILEFGDKKGFLKYIKFDLKYPISQTKKNLPILIKAHQKKLMDYIAKNFTFKNLGIYICLSTGMRIGEICALTWGDIDIENGTISINKAIQRIYLMGENENHTELRIDTPKTVNSIREIPISNELLKIIEPIKKIVNSSFFILTNDACPTEPRTYRNYYNKLLNDLGIPKLKFHGLRHSFATRCIESDCDYKTVSVLLGHSNISTTLDLYVHPNLEQKKKCIEKMFAKI